MPTNGKKTVTQNDVAREAGVARSMVSYVISGSSERSVAPETRRRILEVIDRLGYRPNKAARALQQGAEELARNQLGVVLRSADVFRRPYYAEMIAGIHTAAHQNRYRVHFIRFFEELKDPVLFNELVHPEEICGLILLSTDQCLHGPEDYRLVERLRERMPQIVCVEWTMEGLSSVVFDRQGTACRAAGHLLDKGYGDIAYIGEQDDRVRGVQSALIEHGRNALGPDAVVPAFDMAGGYRGIRGLRDAGRLPRAVVCGSDEVAIGVLCYLHAEQIPVPQRVGVISIDNIEASAYSTPPLTTMDVQKAALGERAVEMIVQRAALQGEKALCLTLPTALVERSSC